MNRPPRSSDWLGPMFLADGLFFPSLAIGLGFGWADWLWAWPDGGNTQLMLAAACAGYGAGLLLIVRERDWRSAIGGAGVLIVAGAIFAVVIAARWWRTGETELVTHAIVLAGIAAFAWATAILSGRAAPASGDPVPGPVRALHLSLAVVLAAGGIALLARSPAIMPWPVAAQSATLLGCLFLGFAWNHGYILLRGRWPDARVFLFGFLVYDLVMAVPLARQLLAELPRPSNALVGHCLAVAASAALAIGYLFVARATRLRRPG